MGFSSAVCGCHLGDGGPRLAPPGPGGSALTPALTVVPTGQSQEGSPGADITSALTPNHTASRGRAALHLSVRVRGDVRVGARLLQGSLLWGPRQEAPTLTPGGARELRSPLSPAIRSPRPERTWRGKVAVLKPGRTTQAPPHHQREPEAWKVEESWSVRLTASQALPATLSFPDNSWPTASFSASQESLVFSPPLPFPPSLGREVAVQEGDRV